MYKYYLHISILFSLSFILVGFSQNESIKDSIKAKIEIQKSDNFVKIYAKAINQSQAIQSELKYSMLSVKKSASGNLSRSVQSGEFSIGVDEVKTLSTQQLNVESKEEIKVYLFIKKEKKVISKDTIVITAIDKKYSTKAIEESDVALYGLIVENTMTKLGKDFYDYFASINQLNGQKYPFVIIINEKPALGGRNSEINISINEEIIYRFRTQPKEEYLHQQAENASRTIYNYHVKKTMLKKKKRVF